PWARRPSLAREIEGRALSAEQAIDDALATEVAAPVAGSPAPGTPAGAAPRGPQVFISHSAQDAVTAQQVCAALEAQGIPCWIAPRDILPGVTYGEALLDAIEASCLVVLVYSAHANASPQVRREVERAASLDLPILPFRLEEAPMSRALQYFLSEAHWLTAANPPTEQHLVALVEAVQRLLARGAVPPARGGR